MKNSVMFLTVITPETKSDTIPCDSVHVLLPDGRVGIRPGHETALFVLEDGDVTCLLKGAETAKIAARNAFLTVKDNYLTLTAEQAETTEFPVN